MRAAEAVYSAADVHLRFYEIDASSIDYYYGIHL